VTHWANTLYNAPTVEARKEGEHALQAWVADPHTHEWLLDMLVAHTNPRTPPLHPHVLFYTSQAILNACRTNPTWVAAKANQVSQTLWTVCCLSWSTLPGYVRNKVCQVVCVSSARAWGGGGSWGPLGVTGDHIAHVSLLRAAYEPGMDLVSSTRCIHIHHAL
jgi:hypothetical protein